MVPVLHSDVFRSCWVIVRKYTQALFVKLIRFTLVITIQILVKTTEPFLLTICITAVLRSIDYLYHCSTQIY
jgi:hypothetical protein